MKHYSSKTKRLHDSIMAGKRIAEGKSTFLGKKFETKKQMSLKDSKEGETQQQDQV